MDQEFLLQVSNICKSFAGNMALRDMSFDVLPGEIHTLLGENGAGKSTLLNIISGSLKMDSGEIRVGGRAVSLESPFQAKKAGIVKVHQELQIVPEMTAYENIFLGNEPTRPGTGIVWAKKMRDDANSLLKSLDADFDSSVRTGTLSTAQQQLVEIAKALLHDFSVLILDEPTSSLTTKEISKLFSIMRSLKEKGKGIVFVSHRLDEVFEVSDRVTIMRDGCLINTVQAADATRASVIQMMTGRDLSRIVKNTRDYDENDIVLSVRNLNSIDGKFTDISFDLHRGEILGFAGLVGAGRTEIVRAVFGADRKKSGEVYLNGAKVNIRSPRDSLKRGVALIPEDRKLQGMVGILRNMNNVGMCSYGKLADGRPLTDKKILENARVFMNMLQVHPGDPFMPTRSLSGGNQQKIVIAKWLSVNARIIIMDEPTRGIDVGAKDEIYRLMLKLAGEGVSIIMISSELPEVISLSNRILVVHEGRLSGEIAREEATEEKILHYAMGGN